MVDNSVLAIIQVVMIIVMGWIAWKRLPFQTTLDRSEALENLSSSLDKALKRQRELEDTITILEDRISGLNKILQEKNYSVTTVFQLGEQPIVKSVTIQPVMVLRNEGREG
jgi:hypothetical protein